MRYSTISECNREKERDRQTDTEREREREGGGGEWRRRKRRERGGNGRELYPITVDLPDSISRTKSPPIKP